uniref:Retrovirus-related Pol polyprotein from transposon TNT 1-94 n=1 Tax=Nelumbo nucifera TaxID=4432 RepID=A0A822YN72_NELNU|nr:TPA_asm: hypothetical protein HUJ06_011882 [Nelumbo nucifera]
MGYVDGTVKPPQKYLASSTSTTTAEQIENPSYKTWHVQDQLLLSWILASLTEHTLAQVVGCITSHQVWSLIETLYAPKSKARIMQLRFELNELKKRFLSMGAYLLKIKNIVDALSAAGEPLSKLISSVKPWRVF